MSEVEKKVPPVDIAIQRVLEEYKSKLGYEISFPIYKIIPDEVKLALLILKRHGMTINITYEEKK